MTFVHPGNNKLCMKCEVTEAYLHLHIMIILLMTGLQKKRKPESWQHTAAWQQRKGLLGVRQQPPPALQLRKHQVTSAL